MAHVLYGIVLYCIILYRIVVHSVLHCIVLYYILLNPSDVSENECKKLFKALTLLKLENLISSKHTPCA